MSSLLFPLAAHLLPKALAQAPCALIGGCSADNPIPQIINPVVQLLIYAGAGLTVLFVIWGGAQMLISGGDESKINSGKMSIIYALIGFALMLASQTVVAFVVTQSNQVRGQSDDPILATINAVINAMLSLFTVVFIIVVIFAGFRMVIGRGSSEEYEGAKRMLIYAVIGAILIHVAKALVSAVLNLGL